MALVEKSNDPLQEIQDKAIIRKQNEKRDVEYFNKLSLEEKMRRIRQIVGLNKDFTEEESKDFNKALERGPWRLDGN